MPIRLALVVVLVAACHTTVRTRVPFASEGGGEARVCADACASARDPAACLKKCPGAVVERGSSCPSRELVTADGACAETRESYTALVVVGVVVVALVGGLLLINHLDNNCPFCCRRPRKWRSGANRRLAVGPRARLLELRGQS